jgi:hypothetical protein
MSGTGNTIFAIINNFSSLAAILHGCAKLLHLDVCVNGADHIPPSL